MDSVPWFILWALQVVGILIVTACYPPRVLSLLPMSQAMGSWGLMALLSRTCAFSGMLNWSCAMGSASV